MLVAVYADLGLPVTGTDAGNRLLVSSSGRRTTVIAGMRVSRFIECPAKPRRT